MKLNLDALKDREFWEAAGVSLPSYDPGAVAERTREAPVWVHFGAGNIFRMFIGGIQDKLIEAGHTDKGIICAEIFDYEIIDRIYKTHDNLVLAVTLHSDGSTARRVIGSLAEGLRACSSEAAEWNRLKEIFTDPGLQIISFTITEKGYTLTGADGSYLPSVKADLENGPERPAGAMAVVCALLYERFKNGSLPIAAVSLDNCSHNGEKLRTSILTIAAQWQKRGLVEREFLSYLENGDKVSFPWTMIDKITPRPSMEIAGELMKAGVEDMEPLTTKKHTYIAPFVNAEGPQYLVMEDHFPNNRPPFEMAGVYLTDRETVNKAERMKVTACLNPLHTALAVYGCLLGYQTIAEEMRDQELVKLLYGIGPGEGMEVVCDPKILSPESFVREVLTVRLPNRFIPDTPQRIACDTSQKVGIRFGETVKAYVKKYGDAKKLHYIPLAIAGWLRYLLAVDDEGNTFELSPDPMLSQLREAVSGIVFGDAGSVGDKLKPILANANIFGIDLYRAGLGEKAEAFFREELEGPGAVRATLKKYLSNPPR